MCQQICRFKAIIDFKVDPSVCEGCAFCFHVCPVNAISLNANLSGHWFISDTAYGPLVHARLGIARENSGKLVAQVRNQAREIAKTQGLSYVISDGPPGIGCPVISALSGASLALLVTEPTLSAMHDLGRIFEGCSHFAVPAVVCINKADINSENTNRIEQFCREKGIQIVARLPYDNSVTSAMVHGIPVVKYSPGTLSRQIGKLWQDITLLLSEPKG